MKKHWQILQPDTHSVEKISKSLKCSPVMANILANRKISSPDDAGADVSYYINTKQNKPAGQL